MSLVSLKCPNCGGEIQLDNNKEFGFCMHCGTKVILQESIKQKVEIDNSRVFKNWIELGIMAMNSGNFDSAEKYAEKILEQDTESGMGWLILAVASSENIDRRWEAFDNFEKAAIKMSYDEKIKHRLTFVSHLAGSIGVELNDKKKCSNVNFNFDEVNNVLNKESEILDTFFSDFSDTERIELLEELYNEDKDSDWAYCWGAMMLILRNSSDHSVVFGWLSDRREMELCVNVISVTDKRDDLPDYLPVNTGFIKDVSEVLFRYVENNEVRVKKADGWWSGNDNFNEDDPNFIKIMEVKDDAYALYKIIFNNYLSAKDIRVDRSLVKFVIGKEKKEEILRNAYITSVREAKAYAVSRLPGVWDTVIEATITYGVDQ